MIISPTLLTIAGSDPCGGAGIQADLKTMTSIGVYGAAVITCLTVQNSHGVQEICPLTPDFIQKQIRAVLTDHKVTHIKIGMTGGAAIIRCLAETLQSFSGEIVYDPVLAATTGQSLLNADAFPILLQELLPLISYLTPNVDELQSISGKQVSSRKDGIECAEILLNRFPQMKAIVVKGGHLEELATTLCDVLVCPGNKVCESKRTRHRNPNLHGTGCTYSSALASYLCMGKEIHTAFSLAGEYMDKIIAAGKNKSIAISRENGPLLHYLS